MKLELECRTDGERRVIAARGDVDLASSPRLRTELLDSLGGDGRTVALDLSGVRYMDSSGVATLVEGLRRAGETGAELRLVAPSDQVRKVLEMTRLETVFTIDEAS